MGLLAVPGSPLLDDVVVEEEEEEEEGLVSLLVDDDPFVVPPFPLDVLAALAARCASCLARRSALVSFGFFPLAPLTLLGLAATKAAALAFFSACFNAFFSAAVTALVSAAGSAVARPRVADLKDVPRTEFALVLVSLVVLMVAEEEDKELDFVPSPPTTKEAAPRLMDGNISAAEVSADESGFNLGDQPVRLVDRLLVKWSAEEPRGGEGGAFGPASNNSSRSAMSDILRASMRKATVRELDEYDECCRTCKGVSLVVKSGRYAACEIC